MVARTLRRANSQPSEHGGPSGAEKASEVSSPRLRCAILLLSSVFGRKIVFRNYFGWEHRSDLTSAPGGGWLLLRRLPAGRSLPRGRRFLQSLLFSGCLLFLAHVSSDHYGQYLTLIFGHLVPHAFAGGPA